MVVGTRSSLPLKKKSEVRMKSYNTQEADERQGHSSSTGSNKLAGKRTDGNKRM
ncbi:hypothetical protein STEG23_007921, partial [Scotinomys teguina]